LNDFATQPSVGIEAMEVELDPHSPEPAPVLRRVQPSSDMRRAIVEIPKEVLYSLYTGRLVNVRNSSTGGHQKACIEWMGVTFAVVRYLDWDASGLYEKRP
jgi:hypothetical protein